MLYLFVDVDGVLINGFSYCTKNRICWYENLNHDLGINYNKIEKFYNSVEFEEILKGNLDLKKELDKYFSNHNMNVNVDTFLEYWFKTDSNLNYNLLNKLSKIDYPKYIVTIQEKYRASYLWNVLNLKKYFDGLFFSGEIGYLKDNLDFFKHINSKLKIDFKKDKIFYIDDNPFFVECSKQCGWCSHLYKEDLDIDSYISALK